MGFAEVVQKRESCRSYSDKKVSRKDLIEIIEMARMSPSACNSQPWKFVVVDDEKAKLMPEILQGHGINKWTDNVSTFVIVCETKAKLMAGATCDSQHYAQMDIGIATANLALSATAKGLSTCIMGSFDEAKVKEVFNIPGDIKTRLVVAVGYAKDDKIRDKVRKSFDDIVSFNGWA